MLIILPRRIAICLSVVEVQLTAVVPSGAVSHRFILFLLFNYVYTILTLLNLNFALFVFLCSSFCF